MTTTTLQETLQKLMDTLNTAYNFGVTRISTLHDRGRLEATLHMDTATELRAGAKALGLEVFERRADWMTGYGLKRELYTSPLVRGNLRVWLTWQE